MDEAFIYVSVITSLFGILGLLILNFFWFKKQTFKLKLEGLKKRQDLEIKKLAKELGIPIGKQQRANINAGELLSQFLPQQEEGGEPGGNNAFVDGLLQYAQNNPEIVKQLADKFLPMLKGGGGGDNAGWLD